MSASIFSVDAKLSADSHYIGDLGLCRLLLCDEARLAWVIAVPRRDAVKEVFELGSDDHQQLWLEVRQVAAALHRDFAADKVNIASFGNLVPMLHVHVIARRFDDPWWPQSAIGHDRLRREPAARAQMVARCRALLIA